MKKGIDKNGSLNLKNAEIHVKEDELQFDIDLVDVIKYFEFEFKFIFIFKNI